MKMLGIIFFILALSGCTNIITKEEAFPEMYESNKQQTMLIVPIINTTTAADASDFLSATVAQPLVDKGYYVLSVPIVSNVFKSSGIIDGTQLKNIPVKNYKEKFGVGSVLFITLKSWETNYMVFAGNVTVGMEYVLVSTDSSNILWSYENTFVLDTTSSSGSLLVDLVATAVSTAMTDYIPVARRVHANAVSTLPVGEYHPLHMKDGKHKNVLPELVKSSSESIQ